MTEIIMVRHGESLANIKGIFAGNIDAPLSDLGRRQAAATRDYLREKHFDAAYASDLVRAFETAAVIAAGRDLTVHLDPRLREIHPGKWEGVKYDDLVWLYPHEYAEIWLHDVGHARCVDGESTAELSERVCESLAEIARENGGKTVLVAAHATPVRAAMCRAMGKPVAELQSVPWVANASFATLFIEGENWSLGEYGTTSYLAGIATFLPKNC